ncbi:stage II sporulation protein P [Anaeroselena agilis]|uniref:Stage II sporulation protein P n=1 Tax=Anaeroselena agilis TaxID=3063788 RepID=A0ABU3NWJ7_9FIRM|nr:stage II sporulation protein P [Selenomonadales bacterium 4137-cl]
MNRLVLVAAIVIGCLVMVPAQAHERNDGGYYTIVDELGRPVFMTGWKVNVGDQCLTTDNKRYEVTGISGDTAHAKFIGEVNLSAYAPSAPVRNHAFAVHLAPRVASAQGNKVAIYHTHSDESYVPTDGKESILGNGGIFKVGQAFGEALKAQGLQPIISNAKHDPHDNMAYERSRRTVADLLKQQPAAVFDVHRDALPAEGYATKINGQEMTKVQLVVGKYGPTGKQIEDYALKIKAAADQKHPGLIKGIFFAKGGDYNQDLHPRSMLLEVGSHTNSRAEAEKGIALFADAIPAVLGQTGGQPGTPAGATGLGTQQAGPSGASKSIGWIVALLVIGVIAFLFISTGGVKEAGAKLKRFTTTEFANFLGPKIGRKQRRDDRDDEGDDSR